jgi:RNA-directed DNA polymerase
MRLRPTADFHPVQRGWSAYFRNGDSGRRSTVVDGYVHERLALIPGRKHGLMGRNRTTPAGNRRPDQIGIFRLTGNAHPTTACQEVAARR